MAFADLSAELAGNMPGLSGFLAENYIKRAWRRIRDARVWSFLIAEDSVVCPAALSAGSFAITQFNNQVTANAVASAALATIAPVILPFQYLQLRFMGTATTSQIYNISSVDTTNPNAYVVTLDRAVVEATNSASPYLCYRPYIAAPTSDFLRWISFVDMQNGWCCNLDYTSVDFDRKDPQRQSLGQAYYLGYFNPSADSPPIPIYELWPGPTSGQTFFVRYRRQGVDFTAPTDVQPTIIPDDLILQAALGFYAYPWAMANPAMFPAMAKVNWAGLIGDAKKTYVAMLQEAKRQDDNQALQSVWNRGHGLRDAQQWPFPIDSNFMQSHLIPL